jgi:hypothetical protein
MIMNVRKYYIEGSGINPGNSSENPFADRIGEQVEFGGYIWTIKSVDGEIVSLERTTSLRDISKQVNYRDIPTSNKT